MKKQLFNKNKLIEMLEKIRQEDSDDNMHPKISSEDINVFEDAWRKIFFADLNDNQWTLECFLSHAVAKHFSYELNQEDPVRRLDINKIILEAKECYDRQFAIIQEKSKNIKGTKQPIEWLDLIAPLKLSVPKTYEGKSHGSESLIFDDFSDEIRAKHYGINIDQVKAGRSVKDFALYTVDQMKELLNKKNNSQTTTDDDVLRFCLNSSFGVYIKKDKPAIPANATGPVLTGVSKNEFRKFFPEESSNNGASNNFLARIAQDKLDNLTLDTWEWYEQSSLDEEFQYPYKGLLRLFKESNQTEFTLSNFISKGLLVNILRGDFISFQPSINEFLLKKAVRGHLRKGPSITIQASDLRFVREEVDLCMEQDDQNRDERFEQKKISKKKVTTADYNDKKRENILQAALAASYENHNFSCGRDVLKVIKKNKSSLFSDDSLPFKDRTCLNLINAFMRLTSLNAIMGLRAEWRRSEKMRIYGAAFFLVHTNPHNICNNNASPDLPSRNQAVENLTNEIFQAASRLEITYKQDGIRNILTQAFTLIT